MYRLVFILVLILISAGCAGKSDDDLIKALYSEDSDVRLSASLDLMQRRGNKDLQEKITGLLSDPQERIVFIATQILGSIGDSTSIETLGNMVDNPNPYIKARACISLGVLGNISAFDYLKKALSDNDPDVRHAALTAIKGLNHIPALESVFPLMSDNVDSIRVEVVDLLYAYSLLENSDIKAADIAPAVTDMSPKVRFVAVQALGSGFPDKEIAGSLLVQALKDENRFVRLKAIRSLGMIGYEEAVPVLKSMYDMVMVDEELAITEAIKSITGEQYPK